MDSARFQTCACIFNPSRNQYWTIQAYVLRQINIYTPPSAFDFDSLPNDHSFTLADTEFNKPSKIDVILGADIYKQVMLHGLQQVGCLLAQQTVFGWTFTGKVGANQMSPTLAINACTTGSPVTSELGHEELLGLMQKFWALEEVPQVKRITTSDRDCGEIYDREHYREPTGRYVVPLPLKAGAVELLGDSLPQAQAALASTHRKMQQDPEFGVQYRKFMDEYIGLGHMRLLTPDEIQNYDGPVNYIPHHGIWQRSDGKRKFRTVFHASKPTSSGYSLNDVLHAGPKLQNHIADVITRWRLYRYAFCADIKMMFRQIRVIERYAHLQRTLWSPSFELPAKHYLLLTVTYGEASAPYLSIRTLHQLCTDEGARFPEAVDAIKKELYVDDFLSGGHDLELARLRRHQLTELLKAGGLILKKWVTNEPQLLEDIPPEDRLRPDWMRFSTEEPVNELGVAWDPVSDNFKFRTPDCEPSCTLTKRKALAELARVFDPLGWLSPITLLAKFIIQDLWRVKLSWDEGLPRAWIDKWLVFRKSVRESGNVSIPRWIEHDPQEPIQLHAFSDASRRAMACVVYSRTKPRDRDAITMILGAKTKLASIRSLLPPAGPPTRMTIPRLELRAALIATRQLQSMARTLEVPATNCHLWSDSQIVLSWIGSDKPVGNDIVDNYVAHIQELSEGATWHHVPTSDNPADIASRGAEMTKLRGFRLWWNDPEWLSKETNLWPHPPTTVAPKDAPTDHPARPSVNCLTVKTTPHNRNHLEKFSTLISLLRSTALVRRLFLRRLDGASRDPIISSRTPVTAAELRQAFLICVRLSQNQTFAREMSELRQGSEGACSANPSSEQCGKHNEPNKITSNRALRSLAPFVDADGILRAGGRLTNSLLPYDEKHPVILDGRTHMGQLIIHWGHERSLHAGFRATYAWVMQRAWIINAKVLVKYHIRKCMVCARIAARPATQGMAPLPAARVTPSRPFERCGVDYAGPFQVIRAKGRGIASFKGYICLFVCMSTKAIHLELVGDLTTTGFLGALTRFVGRRGRPIEIWSDNGTNFRGANFELQRLRSEAELDWGLVEGQLAQEGITWKFIPPSAPHFGGLWEAGVKSTKAHLRRVIGPRRLTYEEFSTLLVSIEAILNSRPLAPPSGDLSDLEALTPSHFLIGTSATSYPQPSSSTSNLDYATHWDLVRGMRDRFWSQWSREYLNTLLQRPKWTRPQPNFCVGDFVVVIDSSLLRSNGSWPMGRIVAVHPGPDGLVRTVTVKTSTSEYTRPIVKLARLPLIHPPDVDQSAAQSSSLPDPSFV